MSVLVRRPFRTVEVTWVVRTRLKLSVLSATAIMLNMSRDLRNNESSGEINGRFVLVLVNAIHSQ